MVASPVLVGRRYRWNVQWEPRRLASPGPRFPNPTATLDPITLPRPARGWLRGYTDVGTTTIRFARVRSNVVTDRFRDGDNAVVMVFRPKAKKMVGGLRWGGGEGAVSIPGLRRAIP